MTQPLIVVVAVLADRVKIVFHLSSLEASSWGTSLGLACISLSIDPITDRGASAERTEKAAEKSLIRARVSWSSTATDGEKPQWTTARRKRTVSAMRAEQFHCF